MGLAQARGMALAGVLLAAAWARAEQPAAPSEPAPTPYAPPPAWPASPVAPLPSVAPPSPVAPPPTVAPASPVAPLPTVAPVAPASDDELPGHHRPAAPAATGFGMVPHAAPAANDRNALGLEQGHRAPKQRYLYQRWPFWVVAGGLVVGMIVLTYAVTRPPPQPYYGNTVGNFNFP